MLSVPFNCIQNTLCMKIISKFCKTKEEKYGFKFSPNKSKLVELNEESYYPKSH